VSSLTADLSSDWFPGLSGSSSSSLSDTALRNPGFVDVDRLSAELVCQAAYPFTDRAAVSFVLPHSCIFSFFSGGEAL